MRAALAGQAYCVDCRGAQKALMASQAPPLRILGQGEAREIQGISSTPAWGQHTQFSRQTQTRGHCVLC